MTPPTRSSHRDAPALIDALVARVTADAGPDADRSARREALSRLLETWEPDPADMALCSDGCDVLGSVYETLLSGAERRAKGQFFTPHSAADLMAAWLLLEPVRLLLDPAVGSGRLLYRAGMCGPAPTRLLGLDDDPIAVELARRNLRWRGLAGRADVLHGDFFTRLPEEVFADALPDAAIVNPPYSRHHAIPIETKAAIHRGFEHRLGVRFSGLAALHALFLVRTIEVCAPGARIAFITPGDWLDAAYGRAIKQWVLAHATIEGLVFFPETALPFGDSVMSSGAITFLRKHGGGMPAAAPTTRVVRLGRRPRPVAQILDALAAERTRRGLRTTTVTLTPATKWSRPAPRRLAGTPLADLARIRRGIATGSNSFFVISDAARRERKLSLEDLQPCVSGPRLVAGLEVTKDDLAALSETTPRWVLSCWRPDAESEDGPLGAYLRAGRHLGVPDGYLASKRRPWYGLERRDAPAILWPYFNRDRLRFVRNRAGALPLNTWLGIEPHDDVDVDRLWSALNDPTTLRRILAARRSYAGMSKLEPSELAAIRVSWRA